MTGIIYPLMLLMLILFHVLRNCWRNIGLILNMIVLINVCFVTRIHRLCLFPVNLILILMSSRNFSFKCILNAIQVYESSMQKIILTCSMFVNVTYNTISMLTLQLIVLVKHYVILSILYNYLLQLS